MLSWMMSLVIIIEQGRKEWRNDDGGDVTMTKDMMSEPESDGRWTRVSSVVEMMSGDGR